MANRDIKNFPNLEPARQYMWEIYAALLSTTFHFRAMSTSIPDQVVEVYEHQYKSTKVHFAGRDATAKTWDFTCIDGVDLFVYKTLFAWIERTKTANKSNYVYDVTIALKDRADREIGKYKLLDAFPENLSPVTLDYSVNDPINVACSFRYDDVHFTVGGQEVASVA